MHRIPPYRISASRPSDLSQASNKPPAPKISTSKELVGTAIDINPRLNIGIATPFSIIGGIKLKEETMANTHSFVTQSPLRQAITNIIIKEPEVADVVWRESIGAVELGFGICTNFPVAEIPGGLGLSFNFGFEPSALLSYRYVRPARIFKNQEKDKSLEDHVVPFPITYKDATSMPMGREVELCGTGKLRLYDGIFLNEGFGIPGIAKVGIGTAFGARQAQLGEYALNVLALDGKENVRVSIRKTTAGIKEFGMEFRAGILNVCPIALPSFGEGTLPALAQTGTSTLIGAAMGSFGAAVARLSSGFAKKSENICCYDLDLSKEEAQLAYQDLLKLNPSKADELSAQAHSGISKVILKEREQSTIRAHNFAALNQQIYGKERNNIKRSGTLITSDKSRILFVDKIHQEKSESWFTGKRELEWEGITVKDSKGQLHTYYRFSYERQNKIPGQAFVDNHFAFAKELGINSVLKEDASLIDMNIIKKLFSSEDDVTASIELFFTEEGVKRLQSATSSMGLLAFQKANNPVLSDENQIIQAHIMLKEYEDLASERWSIFGKSTKMEEIINLYKTNFNRDLEQDLEIFKRAQEFGKFIARFKSASDKKSARDFFALLGSEGFNYKEVLSTLTLMAGRENVKVHKLCLEGGDVSIKSADEGAIIHPRAGTRLLPGSSFDNLTTSYFA